MNKTILLFALSALIFFHGSNSYEQDLHRDILIDNIDTTINPAMDFFSYANGGWIKNNPIPSNESNWGIGKLVMDETYQRMKKLSEEASDINSRKGSNLQKIGDFYFAGMDTTLINKQGVSKLKYEFDMINSITDRKSLLKTIAHLFMIGCNPVVGPGVYQDSKKSDQYALYLWQSGIGLPDRDYYFDEDGRTKKIRDEYMNHVAKMFMLLGENEKVSFTNANTVMKIETSLAKASRKLEDLIDPYANYNKMNLAGLDKLNPSMNWKDFFMMMKIQGIDSVIVGQPEFYKEVEMLLSTISYNNWKVYLTWNLLNTFARYLSRPFDKQNFYFYGTVLSGTKEQRPRWKRILDIQEDYLGDALGQLYVEKYYSPKTKKRYTDLTDAIFDSYKDRIENIDWLTNSTKEKALIKLQSVRRKIGYPDKWKDYSSMNIQRDSYLENIIDGNLWKYNFYVLERIGKPVDREEWSMTPQTYNAYYSSGNNEIVLPAAVFIIPGLPDSLIDDALVYGYAGAGTIGHEITHGFDDEGRQYDAQGNLKNWWTKEDEEKFKKRSQYYVDQFNNYVVLDSLHINGEATLGENIADLGGLSIALDAFKKTEQYKTGKTISGLTPLQRYFLGYALGWLSHQRDESLALQIMTDYHSPAYHRINGPTSNIIEFYEAFNVKEGDAMWRSDSIRVSIW